ncbi:hypothetical protein JG688_00014803, partial [Phytophthora aleatoria]
LKQKRLDSAVVTALAAFRRRQDREAITAGLDNLRQSDALAVARKRVASMVANCSYVPLSDIIRQLCSNEQYPCNLISEDTKYDSSRYIAVSYLDDYIYRPDKLNEISIYEFAMRYYRKKNAHTSKQARLPLKIRKCEWKCSLIAEVGEAAHACRLPSELWSNEVVAMA